MKLHQLKLKINDSSAIETLMNPSEERGLYFYHSCGHKFGISAHHNDSCMNIYDTNEQSYKIVQKITATEIINYDNFIPKNNLQYFLYSLKDGEIIGHFMISGDYIEKVKNTYKEMFNAAKKLTSEFDILILAEVSPKIKRILNFKSENYNPFEKSNVGEKDTFIYHTRTGTFSNLIPKERYDTLDLNDLCKYQPMGHSSLIVVQRIALFNNGEISMFNKQYKNAEEFILFSRSSSGEKFTSYGHAVSYCKEQNAKNKHGCEYLITALIVDMSWH